MAQNPASFLGMEDQPEGAVLKDPSHLRWEDIDTLWNFWYSHQSDGEMGLVFSCCDEQDQPKHMGIHKKLARKKESSHGKQQADRGQENDDEDSSSEDGLSNNIPCSESDEESDPEQVERRQSLTIPQDPTVSPKRKAAAKEHQAIGKDKGKGPEEPSLDSDDAASEFDDRCSFHLGKDVPNNTGDTKVARIEFLKGLYWEPAYHTMVDWLEANLVPSSLTLMAMAGANYHQFRAQRCS